VVVLAVLIVLFAANFMAAQAQERGIVRPLGKASQQQAPQPEAVNTGNGIEYHGGPVMLGPHNVYFIWYGNWSVNTATTILPDFIFGLNKSNYLNTNTTYGDNSNDIANTMSMAGQSFDNYSQGASLGNTGVAAAVTAALNNNSLPADSNGIYLVLTSPDQISAFASNPTHLVLDISGYFAP
jgi:hypothetical protein